MARLFMDSYPVCNDGIRPEKTCAFKELRIQVATPKKNTENYVNALNELGANCSAGYCLQPDLTCDGLLLCGGSDIDPAHYGQKKSGAVDIDPERDAAEEKLFCAFFEAGKPILGICRGMQMINVLLGGTLIQDIGPECCDFHRAENGEDKIHPIRSEEGSLLRQLYGTVLTVNSNHHQALEILGEDLRVTAWNESGFPEAVEHETHPIIGVQFHPERMGFKKRRMDTVDSEPLFEAFLNLCLSHKQRR